MKKFLIVLILILFKIDVFAPNNFDNVYQIETWILYKYNYELQQQFINSFKNKDVGYYVLLMSKKYNINQYFIKKIIEIESQEYIYAKSKVGARGLMQLMKQTAILLNKQIKLKENLTTKDIYNPLINIELGIYYLSILRQKYNDNWIKIIIEYNGGFRNIKAKRIPKETYLYITKLYAILQCYKFNLDFYEY